MFSKSEIALGGRLPVFESEMASEILSPMMEQLTPFVAFFG